MELIDFIVRGKRGRKLLRIFGRWIGVFRAEMAHDRTVDFRGALKRRRGIAPGSKNTASIVHHGGFEAWVCRCHQIGYAPAHAETEDADSRAVDFLLSLEEVNRGVNVRDHAGIAEAGSAGRRRVPATEAVPIVHIGSGGGKTGARKIGRDIQDVTDSTLIMDDDDAGKRYRAIRKTQVNPHDPAVGLYLLPRGLHLATRQRTSASLSIPEAILPLSATNTITITTTYRVQRKPKFFLNSA